jgi:hypothetical protein
MHRPRVGDECWFVEWCVEIGWVDPAHPEYGTEPDLDVRRTRMVRTRKEAERLARKVYPEDQAGTVAFWPATFVPYDAADARRYPHAGYWRATADRDHYEGEG